MIVASVLLAVLLDIVFGEPKRWHPLVGFGALATIIEKYVNRPSFSTGLQQIFGALCWLLIVLLPCVIILLLSAYLEQLIGMAWVIDAVIVYLAIGYTSLRQHAVVVFNALQINDVTLAQEKVAWIVSRDTSQLDALGVRKATIESVLENGSDAIFAPLFWFVVGGVPAIIVYRLANTLDAMWGYKTSRFLFFGRFSARMDDILNYVPSRLVGISYAVLGRVALGIQCWYKQAHHLDSPNGGVVMTAGAGALNLRLGGESYYHGEKKEKAIFGGDNDPQDNDVMRSIQLIDKTLALWCVIFAIYGAWQWLQ